MLCETLELSVNTASSLLLNQNIGRQACFLPLVWTAAAWPSMFQTPNTYDHLILANDTVVSWPPLGFPGIRHENTIPKQNDPLRTQQISSD